MSGPTLTPEDFPAFFAAVHGVPPFPWQERLLRWVADGGKWPAVLDLPTGSGKTAALDIAVFHLALEASRGAERRAPVRIAFVVDRRLIVDDAYERAQRIVDGVGWSLLDDADASVLEARLIKQEKADLIALLHRVRAEPVVARVALRLRVIAGNDEPPLLARRLRGGAPREDDWARTPVQPTILCSTVDQVGSRLLFRGYGVSDRMKPIHAGLLGSDCLILLDEAHLAEPFRQTLAAVGRLRGNSDSAPWGVALLTATPWHRKQETRDEEPFQLGPEDREHKILSKRLLARKPAELIDIPGKQGVPVENRRIDEIAERAAGALRTLRQTIPVPAIGVVVNRVARARAVFERLKEELAEEACVILVIGPARSAGRDPKLDECLDAIRTGGARNLAKPLIVVATQTIEAGVDIDLDGLVTEAAALDALRQRFGRLNRAGRKIAPVAVILAHKDDVALKAQDPVYGDRIAATWNALCKAAGPPDGTVDFGIEAFPRELSNGAAELESRKLDAPVLMPAYADLWSQTSPIPRATRDVGLFLHGADRSAASVQIVWRADLELERPGFDAMALLTAMPPKSGEAIEVSLAAARAWLAQLRADRASAPVDFADAPERGQDAPVPVPSLSVYRWAGPESRGTGLVQARSLRPNDLIVVPATYGGCDQFGWHPASRETVADVADAAAWPFAGRRYAARVSAALVDQARGSIAQIGAGDRDPTEMARTLNRRIAELLAELHNEQATVVLKAIGEIDGLPRSVAESLDALADRRGGLEALYPYGSDGEDRPRGVVFVARRGLKAERGLNGGVPYTEDDDLGSFTGCAQTLKRHSGEVAVHTRRFARRAGLIGTLSRDLVLAAWLHDAGKADRRFQLLLGADPWAAEPGEVLAKSGRGRSSDRDRRRAGLPPNWRHEAMSVRLAMQNDRFRTIVADDEADPELVLWLVGVHHGWGRPLFPHGDPLDNCDRDDLVTIPRLVGPLKKGAGPQSLAFSFDGWDWPQLFERLRRRYGIWGLARLEAIVRLADHRASDAAQRRLGDGRR